MPYQQGITQLPYMAFDYASVNQYGYKNMSEYVDEHQRQLDMYYFTRQINPISLALLSPQTMDPSNQPCNIRSTIYAMGAAENTDVLNIHNTTANNPNFWKDHLPAQAGYHTQNEQTLNNIRPISSIMAGYASSIVDYHGYEL